MDERHPGLHGEGPAVHRQSTSSRPTFGCSTPSRELRPSAFPRRGGPRQTSLLYKMPGRPTGGSSPTCACSTPTCSPTPARSSCSWGRSWPSVTEWNVRPVPGLGGHSSTPPTRGSSGWCAALNRHLRGRSRAPRTRLRLGGFEWIDCHDAHNSVLITSAAALTTADHLVIALNFTRYTGRLPDRRTVRWTLRGGLELGFPPVWG